MIVISAACCSDTSRTIAGMCVLPAFFDACSRRSPENKYVSTLILVRRADHDRLHHALRLDRIRQLLQRLVILHMPRLKGIPVDVRNRQCHQYGARPPLRRCADLNWPVRCYSSGCGDGLSRTSRIELRRLHIRHPWGTRPRLPVRPQLAGLGTALISNRTNLDGSLIPLCLARSIRSRRLWRVRSRPRAAAIPSTAFCSSSRIRSGCRRNRRHSRRHHARPRQQRSQTAPQGPPHPRLLFLFILLGRMSRQIPRRCRHHSPSFVQLLARDESLFRVLIDISTSINLIHR